MLWARSRAVCAPHSHARRGKRLRSMPVSPPPNRGSCSPGGEVWRGYQGGPAEDLTQAAPATSRLGASH